jgi:AraC-like DNA-binding protein/quercetin dioxygenase-like cupin family protein
MKALPFKIPKPSNTAIIFQIDKGSFYGQLHQHEELQISLIQKGRGTLVVADAIHYYQEGDLLILGGNQPHVFRNENAHGMMHTVFYSPLSFGKTFLDLEEGKGVGDFYAFAKAGFKIKASPDIISLFEFMSKAKGIHRLSYFLQLIAILKVVKRETLSSFVYGKKISEVDGQKMNAIFDYSLQNFSEPIYLAEVAEVAAMSPNAFCKYFKKRTNKTYFQFLTEVRIEHACKLLRNHHDLSIVDISEAAGFQTLSHFNRKFKQYKMCSPTSYRKMTP